MGFDLALVAGIELPPALTAPARLSTVAALGRALAIARHRAYAHSNDPALRGSLTHQQWNCVLQSLADAANFISPRGQIGEAMLRATWSAKATPESQCHAALSAIADPEDVYGPAMVSIADAMRVLVAIQPPGLRVPTMGIDLSSMILHRLRGG